MSSLSNIETWGQELNKFVPGGSNMGGVNVKSLASDIASTTMTDVADKDLDYLSSLIFHSEHGVQKFLRANVQIRDPDIVSAQTILLEFLITFIQKAKNILQPYSLVIKNCCMNLSRGSSSRVRSAAIEVITTLIDTRHSGLDTSNLDIKSIYQNFSKEFTLAITKVPGSVKSRILELLGTIAKYHPDAVTSDDAKVLFRWCLSMLKSQLFESQKAENVLIAGSFKALKALLSSPRLEIAADSSEVERLFEATKIVLNMPEDLYRYSAPLSAMDFFAEHAQLFRQYLLKDSAILYWYLKKICASKNRDLSKLAYKTLEALFMQVGIVLSENTIGTQEKTTFLFFMETFMKDFQSEYGEKYFRDISIAVRGVGYFAKACTKHMKHEDMQYLQNTLIKKCSWLFSDFNTEQEKLIGQIPSFIQAFTKFALQLETLSTSLMDTLSTMAKTLLLFYPRISIYERHLAISAVQEILVMLLSKGEGSLRGFLNGFFYHTLVCTCGNAKPIDQDDQPTYKDLLYLWEMILQPQSVEYEESSDISILHSILYDEFLSAFLRLVKTFNLDVRKKAGDNGQEDGNIVANGTNFSFTSSKSLEPINTKDFILFQNLVEFWTILLPRLDNNRMIYWIPIAGTALITESVKKPLVSGYYRMLSAVLVATGKSNVFRGFKEIVSRQSPDSLRNVPESQTDLYKSYTVFNDYMKEVWYRLQQFKDELLASCLCLILTSPLDFFYIQELIEPLQITLRIGLIYHPLATIALDTLDQLMDPDASSSKESELLAEILPYLNDYLMMDLKTRMTTENQKRRFKLTTSTTRNRQHLHDTTLARQTLSREEEYASLRDIQLRIMRYLGRLGGLNKMMLQDRHDERHKKEGNDKASQMLAWDPERKLKVHIPFPNARVTLTLDELLPRICELAESAPDRQVKVAACELLHALVLIMLGNSAFQAKDRREAIQSRYHRIYVRVFPVLLRLAIDMDQVAREMFKSLVSQMIHWLTNNAQYENPETMVLLQTCLDASCCNNAGLRDYGAECLQEFVKWSIKQSNGQAKDGPMNVKSLLKRLFNFMSNPSATKRLGASLIFNRIYTIFREEESLVDKYTLRLLYSLFFSLRLAENDHPSIGTREQTFEAISHVKRILRVKSALFLTETQTRRPFPGGDLAKLSTVVEWSLSESGHLERFYAKTCFDFFEEFLMALPDVRDGKQWITQKLENSKEYLTDIFETRRLDPAHLNTASTQSYILWLRQLTCTLDGYIWLLSRKFVSAAVIIQCESSVIWPALVFYLKNTPAAMLEDLLLPGSVNDSKISTLYNNVSHRLVSFLTLLAESDNHEKIVMSFETNGIMADEKLIDMVVQMLLLPSKFTDEIRSERENVSTPKDSKRIGDLVSRFLVVMHNYASPRFMRHLSKAAGKFFISSDMSLLAFTLNQGNQYDIMQTVEGVKILQSTNILDLVCNESQRHGSYISSEQEYCERLFDKFIDCRSANEPLHIGLLGDMLIIAFNQPGFALVYGPKLLGYSGHLSQITAAEKLTTYQKFSKPINACIATNFMDFSSLLVQHLEDEHTQSVILGLFAFLQEDRFGRRHLVFAVTDYMIADDSFLSKLVDTWGEKENFSNLVAVMQSIFRADPGILSRTKHKPVFHVFRRALQIMLDKDVPLAQKNQALDLLPLYVCTEGPHVDEIENCIKDMVSRQFPAFSKDMKIGTESYKDYITALDKLLNLMADFHCVFIFKILLPICIQENEHIHAKAIQQSISKFAQGLKISDFEDITHACFSHFKDTGLDVNLRVNAINVIISMLPLVSNRHVEAFYMENIVNIMRPLEEGLLRRGNDDEIAQDMKEKSCYFCLMQALYEKLPVPMLHSADSEINKVWEKEKNKPTAHGRTMTTDLVRLAHQAKNKKNPHESDSLTKARLYYQQAAYNAAAAAILQTQKDERFYTAFLFEEKPNEPLWENIIDMNQTIHLVAELNQFPVKMRLEQFITKSSNTKRATPTSVSYMPSVALAGSSLSQQSLFDIALEENSQTQTILEEAESTDLPKDDVPMSEGDLNEGFELDIDQFNKNPCMGTIIKVVRQLHTTIVPPTENKTEMPRWVREVHKAFTASDANLVLRLFIAKVILNYPEAFESYSAHWIRPLIKLVVEGDKYGESMNYIVQDLCVIIITWGTNVPMSDSYDDRCLLFDFLKYLVNNAFHETTRVLRNNIQTIKALFDIWSKYLLVPTHAIYNNLSDKDKKSKRNLTGLQVFGVVLAHGLNPYYNGPEVDLEGLTESKFYVTLTENISNSHRDVYASAAEVAGWSLAYMNKNKSQFQMESFEEMVVKILSDMNRTMDNKTSISRFLVCLHRVRLHYAAISDRFITKLLFLLPQLYEKDKAMALNIIAASSTTKDIFVTLKKQELLVTLNHRDDSCQTAMLDVLDMLAPKLKSDDVNYVLDTLVSAFTDHRDIECRTKYYSVLKKFYGSIGHNDDLRNQVRVCLLKGLTDPNDTIRQDISLYLKSEDKMTSNIYDRLQAVLGTMYMPQVENSYILYGNDMLFDSSRESYDYTKPFFENPLPNARFDESYQNIDTSWQRNSSMVPLFVASQKSTMDSKALDLNIRATQQTLAFSQTQTGDATLLSMLGPSQDVSVDGTPMSLFTSTYTQNKDNEPEGASARQAQYARLRRRFVKSSASVPGSYFRERQDRLQKNIKRYQSLQKQAKEKKITMYRRYRVGELPDIQIKHSELIEPLRSLGRYDNEIARLLHAHMIVAIVNDAEINSSKEQYRDDILQLIYQNLRNSSQYYPPTISSFLRACFELGGGHADSVLINSVSEKSFNQHIGIALLEKNMQTEEVEDRSSKRARVTYRKLPVHRQKWIDLATLYKEIDDLEIFQSIYQNHIATEMTPKLAIDAEIRGDFAEACNLFYDSIQRYANESDKAELNVWEQERMRCYEKLNQWSDVAGSVSVDLKDSYAETLWDPAYRDPYLYYFLRSFVKLRDGIIPDQQSDVVAWTLESPNPIFSFIDISVQSNDKFKYLIQHHASDIALAAIYKKDYDRARHYIRSSYDALLTTWTSLHPLANGSRLSRLGVLQRVVELEDFLDIVSDLQRKSVEPESIQRYVRALLNRYPDSKLDAMDVWDDVVDSRIVFMENLDRLTGSTDAWSATQGMFGDAQKKFMVKMASAARGQNNFNVAIDIWKKLDQLGAGKGEKIYALLQIDMQKAAMISDDDPNRVPLIAHLVDLAIRLKMDDRQEYHTFIERQMTAAQAYELARTTIQMDPSTFSLFLNSKLKKRLTQPFKDASSFAQYLNKTGYKHLVAASEAAPPKTLIEGQCLQKFGQYCDNALRSNENDSSKFLVRFDASQYGKTVINCSFRAMDLGHTQAVERFPRLLELIERYPETRQTFKDNAEKFEATWMYIRWIPQLVAILDSSISSFVFPALEKIAQSYPNALYYSFHISNEHYHAISDRLDSESKESIKKISDSIRSPLLSEFSVELRRLTNPEHILKDFIDFIQSVCTKGDIEKSFVASAYQQFSELILQPQSNRFGSIPKAFAAKHASFLREFFGRKGEKLYNIKEKEVSKLVKYYQKEIQNTRQIGMADLLSSYSPWLSKFQGASFDEQIEIPGQYSGLRRPYPELHTKVASLDDRLLVMSSLRKPKRLCIYGTDEKEYLFLVKGGEDLRLDQRIQQLFSVMNGILRKSAFCSRQNIHLHTYKVIPMATNIGMIEWLSDTKPLRSCIDEQLANKALMTSVQENYRTFVSRFRGDVMGYHNMLKSQRDQVVKNFEQCTTSFRSNILRNYLFQLAVSPEAFLFIRKDFAHSLAAICISGYLLGIGDRHLENFLVDLKGGHLIPIDFGQAFGSATELLPVPELVPFRLTKQLMGVLEPLGVPGLLEVPMTNILQVIQDNKDMLLNTMDVFIKEPLLDWKKVAAKQARSQKRGTDLNTTPQSSTTSSPTSSTGSSFNEEVAWYPMQKLETAKRKLIGENPSYIVATELSNGHRTKPYFRALETVVMGNSETNVRAKIGKKCKNAHEQVQCLIDLATDPDILGRMWIGWQSYL